MLAIRMQRLGRKGHPTYRIVVQDSRQTPTSGKYVALLGSYDPHAKTNTLVKDKAQFYLDHGAQPSDRVVKLFKSEGVKLPKWVNEPVSGQRTTRNPEKLRKNQPADAKAVEDKPEQPPEETSAEETSAEETSAEETSAEETSAEESSVAQSEAPVEIPAEETEAVAEAEIPSETPETPAEEQSISGETEDLKDEKAKTQA